MLEFDGKTKTADKDIHPEAFVLVIVWCHPTTPWLTQEETTFDLKLIDIFCRTTVIDKASKPNSKIMHTLLRGKVTSWGEKREKAKGLTCPSKARYRNNVELWQIIAFHQAQLQGWLFRPGSSLVTLVPRELKRQHHCSSCIFVTDDI